MPTTSIAVLPKELTGLKPVSTYDFDQLYRFAQVFYASGLFEDTADAAQAFAKIAKGQELGLQPMAAMSGFDIVRKRLFVKPWIIAAKINSCGYGTYRITSQTTEECTILFRRNYAGEGWTALPPISYTIAEAKAHGLVDRSLHWKASPAHMLYQRAMGRGGAMYFPELLAGLEAPPEDAEVSREQRERNVVELFDNAPSASTQHNRADVVDVETGEIVKDQDTTENLREGGKDARTTQEAPKETKELNLTASRAKNVVSPQTGWRRVIEQHLLDSDTLHKIIPAHFQAECLEAFHSKLTHDVQGEKLADFLLEWVERAKEER